MRHFFLLLIFLTSTGILSAHKPKVKVETFGNVKMYFRSDFNFGDRIIEAEELKIRAVGKLSKILAEKMNYKDAIMLEYSVSANYHEERELFILESGNSQYRLPFLMDKADKTGNGVGLGIRIIKEKINVTDILKLIEYAILNKNTINNKRVPYTIYLDDDCENKMIISVNTKIFIRKITSQKTSNLIKEIINSNLNLLDGGFTNPMISFTNGEFLFEFNETPLKDENYLDFKSDKYRLRDFKYYIESAWRDFFIVFHDSNSFTYFDGKKENTSFQKLKGKVNDFYPFKVGNDKIRNKVIILNTLDNNFFYVYDTNKKLLQKIE